ncbi:MAG TPA: hypothetical protein GX393_03045 [Firmicutes bacterium]|jgi:hypothetical protein|nr:hypothetical protein [Bacillota bacterium]
MSAIAPGSSLLIGQAGENEGGTFEFNGRARSAFTEQGRIVVCYDSLEVVYDSITSPQPEADVEEGWHLLFIGDPGEMLTVTAS